ncbi:conserved hypothetical protein [Nitrospira defluvii]|uniref:Uncharacterized protein n=1 Tax=Nitrospira defluvii TaxID=330214 RepID=A0ABN7MBF0_9BACT|nr:conserved hypothetical protein [Nitrospira defluvii]
MLHVKRSNMRGGSSPLARGTLDKRPIFGKEGRFIPTRAGNTYPPKTPQNRETVHPHSRGEHSVIALTT